MTKKVYIKFAALFASYMTAPQDAPDLRTVARDVANIFADDNGRFDRDRFMTACGVK